MVRGKRAKRGGQLGRQRRGEGISGSEPTERSMVGLSGSRDGPTLSGPSAFPECRGAIIICFHRVWADPPEANEWVDGPK